jgi:hypothetical protein
VRERDDGAPTAAKGSDAIGASLICFGESGSQGRVTTRPGFVMQGKEARGEEGREAR